MAIKKGIMNKLIIVLLAAIFFTSCVGSKNATHKSDKSSIVIPVQDHYSKSNADFKKYWDLLNAADDPTYY